MKIKAGSIVKIRGYSRSWVALPVTKQMIRRGANARKPGIHLFGGPWYGRDLSDSKTYGKMVPAGSAGRVVGSLHVARTIPRQLKVPSLAKQRVLDRKAGSLAA